MALFVDRGRFHHQEQAPFIVDTEMIKGSLGQQGEGGCIPVVWIGFAVHGFGLGDTAQAPVHLIEHAGVRLLRDATVSAL